MARRGAAARAAIRGGTTIRYAPVLGSPDRDATDDARPTAVLPRTVRRHSRGERRRVD
jgi:hypothetical protein